MSYEQPYTPPAGDPIYTLPKQAQVLAACVRWREGGDTANQPNGAGTYQYTNESLWIEFGGQQFATDASGATALEQDIVFVRTFRVEQFLPWNTDPCIGNVFVLYHDGHDWGWF